LCLQFCDVAQVVIIHNLFSQIWQYSKYEIKKSEAPFHTVSNCGNFCFFLVVFRYFLILKVEFLIEHSFSKYFSQNDTKFPAKKSFIGLCLYAGLGDVQPTLRNEIMVKE
jgi:hypothetical protein